MRASANDPLENFAKRMDRRADHMLRMVDRMVVGAFHAIADQVFLNNPVWSSQSVVNWTASIGHRPKTRLVNVDRSNVGIKNNKLVGSASEGNMNNIRVHNSGRDNIAQLARFQAALTAKDVASTYKRPKRTSKSPKSIWLTNSISYTAKLWTGAWPTNPRTLSSTIDAGASSLKKYKVWRF